MPHSQLTCRTVSRRSLARLAGLLSAMFVATLAYPALAQTYPVRTVTLIVPTATGGANDAMARLIAQALSLKLGKPVIVENKPGGNGAIASEYVARAAADGHTILLGYIATHGINPALQKLRYDPVADFEPIGKVAVSPTLMVVNPGVAARNAAELVALIKSRPGSISFASAGNGTVPHIAGELFKLSTTTDMTHVPYKGSSPALVDTIGGTTQVMFPSVFSAYPFVRSGKLRAIGLAGEKRSPALKDVPTLTEQGIANVNVAQWYALFAPAKTARPIIERLNKELNAILGDAALARKFAEQGAEVSPSTPDELKTLVQQEVVRWKGVVNAARITAD